VLTVETARLKPGANCTALVRTMPNALQMGSRCCQQLLVFHVPDFLICPPGDIGEQLPEPPVRIAAGKLTQDR
jgi:hypothetical protein